MTIAVTIEPLANTGTSVGLTGCSVGNSLIICVWFYDPAVTVSSVTITDENNATPVTLNRGYGTEPNGFATTEFFYLADITTGGAKTITATLSGAPANAGGIFALEISGADKASFIDDDAATNGTSDGAGAYSHSLTTTAAGLLVGWTECVSAVTANGGTQFTLANTRYDCEGQYLACGGAGSPAVAWTSIGPQQYMIASIAVKEGAGGPALVDYVPGVVSDNNGWTDQDDSSDPADIVAAFEAVRDDNTYVKSPLNPTTSDRLIIELRAAVGGGAMQTPIAGTNHSIEFTICADGVINGTVEVRAADNYLVKAWTFEPMAQNSVAGTPEFTVTGGGATYEFDGTDTTNWLAHGYDGSTIQLVPGAP